MFTSRVTHKNASLTSILNAFPSSLNFRKAISLSILNPALCVFVASSLLLHCFCWNISRFLGSVQPPVDQWNRYVMYIQIETPLGTFNVSLYTHVAHINVYFVTYKYLLFY